ncbi:hypothetical protein T484DRAFT_3647348, partial [Baffinella frigidus]
MPKNADRKFNKIKAEQLVKSKPKVLVKKRYIGTIDVKFMIHKNDNKPYEMRVSIPFDKVINESDIDTKATLLIEDYKEKNEYLHLVVKSYTGNVIEQTTKNNKDIKMKDRNALNVGVQYVKSELFDKGNGQCVFDFIQYRYGDIKGFINICKDYRMLASQMLPIQHEDEAKMDLEIDDLLKNGVTCEHVMNFCKWHKIHCYALDCMDTTFDIYQPENKNKKAGSLVFRISNNHIYPVVERKYIQSVIQSHSSTENNRTFTSIEDIEKVQLVEKDLIVAENIVDTKEYMMSLIKKNTPKKICLDVKTKAITKFELDGKMYIINQQVEARKKICNYLEVEFTGQGFANLLELICGTWEYSKPNPETFNILLEAKKGRAHYGFINEDCEMKMRDEKNCIAYDICKCYSHLMKSPSHDWLIMDFNACFEDFNGNNKKGLYLIETDDTTLFKGDGLYSHNIVLKAKEEDINFRILKVMYASRVLPKDYITEKINKINDCLKDDVALKKFLINMFHGNMAKTNKKFLNCNFTQSSDDVFSWMSRYSDYIDKAFV